MANLAENSGTKHQSIRLFKNPLLEALTHVHPSVPFILWIPIIFAVLYRAEVSLTLLPLVIFFALGLFFWTATEYLMHRYVFHFEASTKAGKYLVFLFHGIHHDDPQDPTRLVMPPAVSLLLGSAFYFLFLLMMGPVVSAPFFSGFIVGYLIYDYIHFAIHHFKPRTEVGRILKDNHMKHHFIAQHGKWGVSSPLWDHVFGTFKQD